MHNLLSLEIPGTDGSPVKIQAPPNVPTGANFSIGFLATRFLQLAMVFGIILSIVYFAYGGFYWIQSKGDKEKLDKARRILTFSILGLIIMSISLIVVNLVGTAVGVKTLLGN